MADFQHLNLIQVIERKPFIGIGGGPKKGEKAKYNLEHRQEHFDNLTAQLKQVKDKWEEDINKREEEGLPKITDSKILPLFLHIDLAKDVESLKSFGIEIISEEEDGFIIGANSDDFKLFADRLEQFLNQTNKKFKDSAASVLEVIAEPAERLSRILSEGLLAQWEGIGQQPEMVIYVAISSYLKIPDYPNKTDNQTDGAYARSIERWKSRYNEWQSKKDELAMARQTAFENFIRPYNAIFLAAFGQYTDFDDGFACKIRISGKGLRDLALNFPFVFYIEEHDPMFSYQGTNELEELVELNVLPPIEGSAKVCVVDSGIQEGHLLLAPAIDSPMSISFVPLDPDTFDKVDGGGHGTKVAGAILYPAGINRGVTEIQTPCWVQNARILNDNNKLDNSLNEADLMRLIVQRFNPTKLYNLSVGYERAESYTHMPVWSATIDKIIWENDVLFFVAAGNVPTSAVTNYIVGGSGYPHYLREAGCRITNPGFSCFSITVGSVSDVAFEDDSYKCVAGLNLPSAFSRCGPGLWGMIKPDVVEYGGDFVSDKNTPPSVSMHDAASPNLVRSTRDNGPAVGRDIVGTSFTTPKVTHIAAALQTLYPAEHCLLYRALIIQSAKLPFESAKVEEFIRYYGYGVPDLERATRNSAKRVTLFGSGKINAKHSNIYLVKIPNEINRPGYEFNVLIEITLSYKAEPRITRRKTSSYLSTWLDWEASRKGEDQKIFSERILAAAKNQPDGLDEDLEEDTKTGDSETKDVPKGDSFEWVIGSKGRDGEIKGIKRQDSSVQKDWCIEKSNQLPAEFLIAVKGHKGWEKDLDKEIPYSVVVSFEILDMDVEVDIYNEIRIANEIEIENEQEVEIIS